VAPNWVKDRRKYFRGLGLFAFCLYLIWNFYWLSRGIIPPSIILEVFGLPAPTTGCMRSLVALMRGDIKDSIFWNAFLIPILFLLAASAVTLSKKIICGRPIILPYQLGRLWILVLGLAWLMKFFMGPESW